MLKCHKCGATISEREMRKEIGRLMNKRRPPHKATLTPEQAREYGRLGAQKRWAKALKKKAREEKHEGRNEALSGRFFKWSYGWTSTGICLLACAPGNDHHG
jgi:hypothetical protein